MSAGRSVPDGSISAHARRAARRSAATTRRTGTPPVMRAQAATRSWHPQSWASSGCTVIRMMSSRNTDPFRAISAIGAPRRSVCRTRVHARRGSAGGYLQRREIRKRTPRLRHHLFPTLGTVPGYVGTFLGRASESGQVISLSFWRSERDAVAGEEAVGRVMRALPAGSVPRPSRVDKYVVEYRDFKESFPK